MSTVHTVHKFVDMEHIIRMLCKDTVNLRYVAEQLHNLLCTSISMRMCDWHTGTTEKPSKAQVRYIDFATDLREIIVKGRKAK